MNPETFLQVLPKIASHPLAILGYVCFLGVFLVYGLGWKKFDNFQKTLEKLPRDQRTNFIKFSGYKFDDLAAIPKKQRFKLIVGRYILVALIIGIVAILLFALASIICLHNYSELKSKYDELNKEYNDLQVAVTELRLKVQGIMASSDTAATQGSPAFAWQPLG